MKRTIISFAILLAFPSAVMANDIKETEYGVRGNIVYNYTDFENEALFDDDSRLEGTQLSVTAKNEFRPNTFLLIDLGAGQNTDLVYDDFKNASDIDFETNQLLLRGKKDGFNIDFGRMFTPIGHYDDPLSIDNLFNDTSQMSRYIDGLNISYSKEKLGMTASFNVFAGTRLDNANLSSSYGGKISILKDNLGVINLGYADFSFEDDVLYSYNKAIFTDQGQTINISYVYESDSLNFVIKRTFNDFENLGNIDNYYGKLSYNIDRIEPYMSIDYVNTDLGNEEALIKEGKTYQYSFGMDMQIRKNFVLFGEYSYFNGEANNSAGEIEESENMYKIGLKFNY